MPMLPVIWCLEQMFELSFGGTVYLLANFFMNDRSLKLKREMEDVILE